MKSHESINRHIWRVLQKIKINCIQNTTGNIIRYDIDLIHSNHEIEILKKLETCKAIKIKHKNIKENLWVTYFLQIIEPIFSEMYCKFELLYAPNLLTNSFLDECLELSKPCFQKHFLHQELERFELVLRHFLQSGGMNYKDYEILVTISKMMKTLVRKNISYNGKITDTNIFPDKKITHKGSRKQKLYQPSLFSKPQPVSIVGEITVSGLNERLDALKPQSPQSSGPKFPHKIPAGTRWDQVTIIFLDDENIEIQVKGLTHTTNYKEMGMCGKGNIPSPNEQWVFLRILAQLNGELTIKV